MTSETVAPNVSSRDYFMTNEWPQMIYMHIYATIQFGDT